MNIKKKNNTNNNIRTSNNKTNDADIKQINTKTSNVNTNIKQTNKAKISNTKINNNEKEIHCKYCGSTNIIKKGINYNKQNYRCKECSKYFRIGDDRIKRNPKEKELALLMYSHNVSLRSTQSVLNKYFDTNISFNVIDNWIKTSAKLLNYDINRRNQEELKNKKPRTISILEIDEMYSYFYDLKKNEKKQLKYGLLLIDNEIKFFQVK